MFWKRSCLHGAPRCSFCRRTDDIAGQLISSTSNDELFPPVDNFVYSCAECVAVCHGIIDDRSKEGDGPISDRETIVPDSGAPPFVRLNRNRTTPVRYSV